MKIPTLREIFVLAYEAPLSVRVQTRQGCTYLYRMMKLVGWIPPEEKGRKRNIYLLWSSLVFAICTIYIPIGLYTAIVLNFKTYTLGEFLAILQIALNNIGITMKAIIMITFISQLSKTELILDQLDERRQSDQDRQKVHKLVAFVNFFFAFCCSLCFACILSFLGAGIFTGQPPWMVYLPMVDWRAGGAQFWIQCSFEYIFGSLCVIEAVLEDAYCLVFVLIFRGHIHLLKEHIRNLRTDLHKTESENYEDLRGCIIDHKLILSCFDTLRPLITRTIFVQFLLIGVVLGINLINLTYFENIYHAFSSAVYLTCLIWETFPFCLLCDLILQDCDDLAELLSHSNWVDAEPRYKSTLKIYLHHLQQPINFNAGGIFPISLTSNIKVAKFAFTVITIVKEMNLLEKFEQFGKNYINDKEQ